MIDNVKQNPPILTCDALQLEYSGPTRTAYVIGSIHYYQLKRNHHFGSNWYQNTISKWNGFIWRGNSIDILVTKCIYSNEKESKYITM